ncbi:MAG: 23S rRNA (guanosine(2251)-2'-O)-methyltransferase RlmB [Gammaproteobacteria bacterium]|nr:23S rRNA (guanosine(2251)-2'-O)-methyltransferase RlmB [Gammaproteobacteria bacterium]
MAVDKKYSEYAFGLHAARRILDNDISRVMEVWVRQGHANPRILALLKQAEHQSLAVQRVPEKTLDRLTGNANHQGIVLRCKTGRAYSENDLEDLLAGLTVPPFLLVLDGVQDPHNLGACLRSADAAGVHFVIVPKDRACGLSSTVRKVACGAAEAVPLIQVTNLSRTLRRLREQDIRLAGAADDAEPVLFDTSLTGPLALVLGAEEKGLRRLTRECCDTLVRIPMAGKVESLNVSVAAGVCLFEAVRQRTAF